MSRSPCLEPIGAERLLDYWLRELDESGDARVEDHLFGCDACTAALEGLAAFGGEIRACVQQGLVGAVVTDMYTWWLRAAGLRLREYRVARDGSVQCTVAPDDDIVVARLEAPLAGIERLDLVTVDPLGAEQVLLDVPFDPAAGEVVLAPRVDHLRALPASTVRMRLIAHRGGTSSTLGEYEFVHTPWV